MKSLILSTLILALSSDAIAADVCSHPKTGKNLCLERVTTIMVPTLSVAQTEFCLAALVASSDISEYLEKENSRLENENKELERIILLSKEEGLTQEEITVTDIRINNYNKDLEIFQRQIKYSISGITVLENKSKQMHCSDYVINKLASSDVIWELSRSIYNKILDK